MFFLNLLVAHMKKNPSIAIVGATGAVGKEILSQLESRNFPVRHVRLFASEKSLGQKILFNNEYIDVQILSEKCFLDCDLTFFCAGSTISRLWAHKAIAGGSIVIDNSSAFRTADDVPLVIPEINPEALSNHRGLIANPNCSTIIMLMALFPLHKAAKIKRIIASTYQAASGAGEKGMTDLLEETKSYLNGKQYKRVAIPFPYAFNLFLHSSPMQECGYNEEELKMIFETRKILSEPHLKVSATCVRVPVLRAHSESINVEFENDISTEKAKELLENFPGIKILEDRKLNRFAMPIDALGKGDVFCGRIRKDLSQENTLDLWVVADQLLKGAALNAVQIAEKLYENFSKEKSGSQEKESISSVTG